MGNLNKMVVRLHYKISFMFVIVLLSFFYGGVKIIGLLNQSDIIPLKSEVSVVIVDEHQEVIPYWYQAVEEGIIKSSENTLIHIDGHSDMAVPSVFKIIDSFVHKIPSSDEIFLPLMQSNDVFIISAIAKGLIERVIWVQPTWLNASRYIRVFNSYVGWYQKTDKEKIFCECQQAVSLKKKTTGGHYCNYLNRESIVVEDMDVQIPVDQCHKIKDFKMISLSETKFKKYINVHKIKNLFVDIDEDFFGVESGVQSFIDQGLPLEVHDWLNVVLNFLVCPISVAGEQYADSKLNRIFKDTIKMKEMAKDVELVRNMINKAILEVSTKFRCDDASELLKESGLSERHIAQNFTDFIIKSPIEQLKVYANLKFCLRMSPILKERPNFFVCSGNIYPNDPLNQIYISSDNELKERAKNLTKILTYINSIQPIKFISIARSLRDGYTPRRQQRSIEKLILSSLHQTFSSKNSRTRIKYDKNLVFGIGGWPIAQNM